MSEPSSQRHDDLEPSDWVARFLTGLEAPGALLDVACGRGRHLRYARTLGHRVTGLDRDLSGLADLANDPDVRLIEADLEGAKAFPLAGETFGAVVVANYLWRPLFGEIAACVAPEGLLIYETFARGNERYGKPTNPDFLLKPNELIEVFAPYLTVIAYEHGLVREPRPKLVQRIAACGRAHPWAGAEPFSVTG